MKWSAACFRRTNSSLFMTCGLNSRPSRSALWHNNPNYAAESAALLTAFGVDALSDWIGEAEMISRDTFKWRMVAYAVKQGNPPEIHGIIVGTGTGTFTGVNTYGVDGKIDIYLPVADANGDGFPDPGATPVVTVPIAYHNIKRVSVP